MRFRALVTAILPFAVAASGCAELTHLTRTRQLGKPTIDGRRQAFFIDAKQRAIFQQEGVICAEPSPDALSALAVSQGLNIATPEGTTIGQSLSVAEAAASIGLRTQSIQLMRDHMYRICEGYQSGAISQLAFQLLHRRFQTTMVGILAIEQLTGAVRPPAVVLGGSSSTGSAQAVADLTATREAAASSVREGEVALKTAQAADATARAERDAAQITLDQATEASAKEVAAKKLEEQQSKAEDAAANLLAAEGALAGRKAALDAIDRQLVLARSAGSASATGAIEAQRTLSGANAQIIATTVGQIVEKTMDLTNQADFCIMVLAESAELEPRINVNSPIVATCTSLITQDATLRARLVP